MPRRRAKSQKPQYKMVNVDFNDKEKLDANSWIEHTEISLIDHLLTVADANYKSSFSRDDYHDCYVASLTPKSPVKGTNEINVYIIRHRDFQKLLEITCYFWTVMLDNGENGYSLSFDEFDW